MSKQKAICVRQHENADASDMWNYKYCISGFKFRGKPPDQNRADKDWAGTILMHLRQWQGHNPPIPRVHHQWTIIGV